MISFVSDHLTELILLASVLCMILLKWRQSSKLNLPPGPPGWPLIGNLLTVIFQSSTSTNDDYYFTKCAKKYGNIYKLQFGPQLFFVLCDVDYMREAFNNPNIQERNYPIAIKKAYGENGHGIIFATKHHWQVGRQFVLNLFRELGVGRKDFHNTITSEIDRLNTHLDSCIGQPIDDIADKIYISISNVINGVVFGKQFDYDDMDFQKTISNNKQAVEEAGPSGIIAISGLLCALPFGPGKRLVETFRRGRKFRMEIIEERQRKLNVHIKPTNYVDAFLIEMKKDNDSTFNAENIVSSCNDLFIAGTDTTASTLTFAILFLATHPRVQENCQKELQNILGDEGFPDYSEKSKFPYLQATIQETERLGIVVPLGVAHFVDCDEKLFGYDCPKGTSVMVNMGSIFMNEDIFENPREFKPERFLKDGCFQKSPHIIPFSVGKRVCPGEQLSRMEMFLFLSHLVRRYTFHLPKDTVIPNILDGHVGAIRYPLPFTVTFLKRSV